MNVFGIPVGGEQRWKTQHLDMENSDYTGMPIAGMRTLESYGESVIEDYYDINKRQTDILNPPIALSLVVPIEGLRGVAPVSPSCSDAISSEALPQYTTSGTCQERNGDWYVEVFESCSDPTYVTEVNCIVPNGTWSSGSCSNGSYNDQGACEGAGTCWDSGAFAAPQWNNNETGCLAEGTCSDPAYNNNEAGCLSYGGTWTTAGNTWQNAGHTWSAGSCSDVAFTDQPSCEAPRGVWTPTVAAHCQDVTTGSVLTEFVSQATCEADRGIWDPTQEDAITGAIVQLTGEGIDEGWVVTLGGFVQNTTVVLLPTRVDFEVTAGTPLGEQPLVITNPEGDFDTAFDPFTVQEQMRVITVYQPGPRINAYGEQNASSNSGGNWMTGHQSAAGQAEFYVHGIGFVDGCTVTVQKSSATDHPQNYLAGGYNTTIFTATPYDGVNVWQSATELMCIVDVTDIPVTHDATIGGDKFGVMYYDVTVTNPDGSTFTKKASSVPGARIHALDNGASYCDWRTDRFDAGNGVRVWGYTLPNAPYIIDASLSSAGYVWDPVQANNTWDVQGLGYHDDGVTHFSVVTIESWDGKGIVYTPQVQAWSGDPEIIRVTGGAVDVNTGAYPPTGNYRVTVTNPDGAFDDGGYLVVG